MASAPPTHTPLNGSLGFRRQEKPTGLAAVACSYAHVDVKIGRAVVGILVPPSARSLGGQDQWCCRLMVRRQPTPQDPAPFKWVTLRARKNTENEMRAWLGCVWTEIRTMYDLYPRMD
jgi:hypothetical protein